MAEAELSRADASTFVATDMWAVSVSSVAPYYSASALHGLTQRLLRRDHEMAGNKRVETGTKKPRFSRAANKEKVMGC